MISRRHLLASEGSPAPFAYTAGAQAYFAALPTQPDARVKLAYDNLWRNYNNVMSLHDLMYINVAQYEDNKRTNLILPGSYYQSKISSPVFFQMNGVSQVGTLNGYNSGFVPSVDCSNFTLTDCCFWVYNGSGKTGASRTMAGCSVLGEGGQVTAGFDEAAPAFNGGINAYNFANSGMSGQNDYYGLWSLVRSGNNVKVYHNGVQVINGTDTPLFLPDHSFCELVNNRGGTIVSGYTGRLYASGWCKGTTSQTDLYAMLQNYFGDLPVYHFYGDSEFTGYALTNPQTESIPYLLSTGKGCFQFNNAIASKTVKNFIDSGVKIEKSNSNTRIFFDWYLNDCSVLTTSDFKIYYRLAVDMAIASGCPASRIYIIKRWYQTNIPAVNTAPFTLAAQEVADEYGITTFDLYSLGYELQPDNLHPTAAGCVTAANYLIANT
jgi:hypothetical protein